MPSNDVTVRREPVVSEHPNTREVLLEGLRQALQARVVQIYSTVTMAGEPDASRRAERGLATAIKAYEAGWKYIDEIFSEKD